MDYVTEEDLMKAKDIQWEEGDKFKIFITQETEAFLGGMFTDIPDLNFPVILKEGEYYKGDDGFFDAGERKFFPLVPKEAWDDDILFSCIYAPFENLIGRAVLIDLDLSPTEEKG